MTEPDRGVIHDAEAVVDYLTRERITLVVVGGEGDGIDSYVFMPADDGPNQPFELGTLTYDRVAGEILPVSPEAVTRRMRFPGFVDAIASFGRMLDRAKGDFSVDEFDPVHNALSLIDFPPNSPRNR